MHRSTHLTPEAIKALDAGDVEALLALSRARYAGWTMEDAGDGGSDSGDAGDGADDSGSDDGDDSDKADDKPTEDARVTRANKEAAKYRTELRAAQDALTKQGETLAALAKVFNPDSKETDPAAQLAEVTGKAETLQTENAALSAALLVHDIATEPEVNAKASALLDSKTFTTTLAGLDPAADDYRAQVTQAIKDAVEKNAAYRAGQGSGRGGSELDPQKREPANKQRPTSLSEALSGAYASN